MTESFSSRLNAAMAFRNVKQIDFVHAAEKFNIKLGKSHMSQYVSGKTVPRADIAHFLAAFLQVNEDWLMGKDVPMEQNPAALPAIESDETRHDSNPASAQSKEGKTMRTFAKSHKLDNVLYDVRGPVADEAARMEAAGTHILKLNIGNPAPFGFEWYPDIDDIRSKITDKTKAIVIINPNNPTGALYPKELLQQIVDIAREHQLIIFSDEIYDRLVMDGLEHISIASLAPDLFCVTFSGLSKSHMIAGYRIGWMILSGNKRIAKDYIEGLNMLANMRMCSNVPAQSVVQTALGGHQSVKDYIKPGGRVYEQRELVYRMLNEIPGVTAVKPKAAFYIFPKLDVKKFNIHSDEQFALDLLHDKHILISHGGAFNWQNPDHFRVVYLPRITMLKETIGEIADFLSTYHQA